VRLAAASSAPLWVSLTGCSCRRSRRLLPTSVLSSKARALSPPQVALQRRMFEEYERRERRRRVAELREVCPGLSEEEAEQALELCDGRCACTMPRLHCSTAVFSRLCCLGTLQRAETQEARCLCRREDEAAALLVSDPGFKRQVQEACSAAGMPAAAVAPAPRREPSRHSSRGTRPAGPRPKIVDPATLGTSVRPLAPAHLPRPCLPCLAQQRSLVACLCCGARSAAPPR
jgi:hypothetical protein